MLIFQFDITLFCKNSIPWDGAVIKWDFIDEQETSTWIEKQMKVLAGYESPWTAYFVTEK